MAVSHEWTRRPLRELEKRDGMKGELRLVITIDGAHDIYRFAHHMLTGQVEFSERARQILASLKRRLGPTGNWGYLDRQLGGWRLRGERPPRDPKPAKDSPSNGSPGTLEP